MRKSAIAIALVTMLFAALCLAGCGGSGNKAADPAKAKYDEAVALFEQGKFYSAKVAFEESEYEDWEDRAAACVQPFPATGELFHKEGVTSDDMRLDLSVYAEDESVGRYISVYTEENELVVTVFIQGSGTVGSWLPGGNYYIRDAAGYEWYGEDEQFGPDGSYEKMVFDEVEGDRYLTVLDTGYAWEISINSNSGDGQDVDSETTGWEDRG